MERTVLVYLHAHMLGQKLGHADKRLLVCPFIRGICGSESGPKRNGHPLILKRQVGGCEFDAKSIGGDNDDE